MDTGLVPVRRNYWYFNQINCRLIYLVNCIHFESDCHLYLVSQVPLNPPCRKKKILSLNFGARGVLLNLSCSDRFHMWNWWGWRMCQAFFCCWSAIPEFMGDWGHCGLWLISRGEEGIAVAGGFQNEDCFDEGKAWMESPVKFLPRSGQAERL